MVFGRGGEEVLYFRSQGFEAVVVPGISSSLAGPTFVGIPVTQRGVAHSLTICTGVGRKGTEVELPRYERSRTLVILMGVARLAQIVKALMGVGADGESGAEGSGLGYPPYLPIAVVERASSPDQRMIASTLDGIVEALDRAGEQRPPGMIVVGWVVLALHGAGDLSILDDSRQAETQESLTLRDLGRISRWGQGVLVRDGLSAGWEQFF
jgi:uroporphyrin-III C-methyltransferase